MDRKLRTCLSLVVGVLFGLWIAFKVRHSLWWLGMLTGSCAGMLIYRWDDMVDAIVESLPGAEGIRRAGRKFALAITAFFVWLGWAYILILVMHFVRPGWIPSRMFASGSSGWGENILIVVSSVIIVLTLPAINAHGDAKGAGRLAKRYLKATYPLVLGWYIPQLLIWIVCHPIRVTVFTGRIIGFLTALVATPFIAICSRKSLVIGFSISVGVADGYLMRIYSSTSVAISLLVGVAIALVLAAVGLFLSDAAKQWVREEFG